MQHQGLVMKEELKRMKRVLRRVGFINADNVLSIKVNLTCFMSTCLSAYIATYSDIHLWVSTVRKLITLLINVL